MKFHRSSAARPRWAVASVALAILALASILAACGGPTPTPEIVIITATFTPASAVQVITATFTPAPEVAPTDTLPPPPPAPSQGGTGSELPPTKEQPTATLAASEPTESPEPSPSPTTTPTTKPAAKPASLKSYFVVYTAYQGPDLQDYSLWGMNGDGSGVFKVEGAGQASEPAFSPDGNKFAFYHWTDGLYIWNLDAKTSRHFVQDSNASFPTWAPKGQRLAYFVAAGQRWIYIVNADGSGQYQLTPGMRPNWSLKGGFIAYDTCENNKCGIFRINPDGGGKSQLTSDSGGGAAVSPDGTKIAYWSQIDGDFEVYVINASGGGKRQLTKNTGNDALPAWSPDGKVIYYLSDQNGKGWAVMAMNADGSNPRRIVKTNAGNDPVRGWQYQRITVTWDN